MSWKPHIQLPPEMITEQQQAAERSRDLGNVATASLVLAAESLVSFAAVKNPAVGSVIGALSVTAQGYVFIAARRSN